MNYCRFRRHRRIRHNDETPTHLPTVPDFSEFIIGNRTELLQFFKSIFPYNAFRTMTQSLSRVWHYYDVVYTC